MFTNSMFLNNKFVWAPQAKGEKSSLHGCRVNARSNAKAPFDNPKASGGNARAKTPIYGILPLAFFLGVIFLIQCISLSTPVYAASGQDPNWPCIQRKVDEISIGQMWPIEISSKNVELSDAANGLVAKLSLRRVDEAAASEFIKTYMEETSDVTVDQVSAIYQVFLKRLNQERHQLISGIERYAKSQQDRSVAINELRSQMEQENAAQNPDFDKLDKFEESLDWNQRIYKDREEALTYVCETPVILEKRAYAIAQLLLPWAQKIKGTKN